MHDKIAKEAFMDFFDNFGKLKKITQQEIDVLKIETSKIDSIDDKIYILDSVYKKLNIIDNALQILDSKDKEMVSKVTVSKTTLDNQRKQLLDIRDSILNKNIVEKSYGLFVKYPKGYEG